MLARASTLPFALPELEALVRTLDPAQIDTENQYQFYALLADAYAAAGRLAAESERLTAAVRAGHAGEKDLLLWAELALRQPREAAEDLAALAEQRLLAAGTPGDYQRIQLARLYARAGRTEPAIGLYSVATVVALASPDFRFNRSDSLPLFSAMGFYLDAARYLDAAGLARFVTQLAQITKPSGGPAFDLWHQRFLLWLIEHAFDANVPAEILRNLLPAVDTAQARREDLIRYAAAQSRLATPELAVTALRDALRKGANPRPAPSSPYENNATRYSLNLGFRSTQLGFAFDDPAGEPSGVLAFKGLFPTRVEAWPGAREWITRSARSIPAWIASSTVDTDLAVQVLALVTLRLQQLGLPEAKTSAGEIAHLLVQLSALPPATASLAIAVADRAQTPVDLAVIRNLAIAQKIDPQQLAGLIRRTAEAEGTSAALTLGDSALAYTQNDALLGELESLAKNSGNDKAAKRYGEVRQQAAAAREQLNGGDIASEPARI